MIPYEELLYGYEAFARYQWEALKKLVA